VTGLRRLAVAALAAVALVGAAGGADIARDRGASATVLTKVTSSASARFQPGGPTEPTFVLVIGSDEREGLEGERADGLHLVGLNPAEGRATILNFPRDTWVPIPGRREMRINEAFNEGGGPALQAATVEQLTGVRIDYVLTTTFTGLEAMVDGLGGIEVDVPENMDDRNSGADFTAGRNHLNGAQALAFSRNRNLGGGDFTRTANQGRLIVHTLETLRARGTSGTDVVGYLDVLLRNVRTENAGPADLYHLGRAALAVDPAGVRNVTVPARDGMAGRAAVVYLEPGAPRLFADFADDAVLQDH
jgi:polyisoprenyl-teichoic acid--peptidoglycan teichoic acid transferase